MMTLHNTAFTPVPSGGQTISLGASSAKATNPAPQGIRAVMIQTTEDAYVRFDVTGASATTSDMLIDATFGPQIHAIPDGAYVHALQAATGGTLTLHWMKGR